MRKLEIRIRELLDAESERQVTQTAFIERINLAQVERERAFKTWSERFDRMEDITKGLDDEISGLEETHSEVRKALKSLDEVTQRFDRRVNEITEVQRLNEDRFRQEWTTFKSDDQKRWSNYVLAQDEQFREMARDLEGFGNRIANLEDLIKGVQDTIAEMGRDDLKRMQAQLATIRESIEAYNKIFKE
jgi:phage shock protein A